MQRVFRIARQFSSTNSTRFINALRNAAYKGSRNNSIFTKKRQGYKVDVMTVTRVARVMLDGNKIAEFDMRTGRVLHSSNTFPLAVTNAVLDAFVTSLSR